MKLALKMVETPGVCGGVALALVDENDDVLPNQLSTITETGLGDLVTINVTFQVDGKNVRIG